MDEVQKDLINRCINGERKAQQELYLTYNKAMYNLCLRMLNQQDHAQDVLQDAFVSAFKNLQRFKQESTFGAWLKKIVVNHCLNFIQKNKKSIWVSLDENRHENIEEESTFDVLENIGYENFNHAIKNLPEGCRMVLTLFAFENYPHAEVAKMLNISVGTSKSQYNRAKSLLKQELKKLMPC